MNIFNRKDKVTEELKQVELEIKEQLNQLSIVAKDILQDTRYRQFTDILRDAEKNTTILLLDMHKVKDPDRHRRYDELLTELGVYRNIIKSVSDLANPQKQSKPNLVQNFKNEVMDILGRIK